MQKEEYLEKEIDLRELILGIWGKKLFIIIFTGVVTLLAILYVYTKTPIYEVETVFKIGDITDSKGSRQLESSNTIINRLNIIHNINIPKEELTRLSSISIIKGSKNLIKIKVVSTSNEKALEKLKFIIDSIKSDHKIKIDNYLKIMNEKLNLLISEENRFNKETVELNKDINKKENSISDILKTNPVAAVYTMNLNAKTNELIELKDKAYRLRNDITNIKISLLDENIQPTKILGEVITSKSPIKPKKILIVVVSFVTGFILSIFLVFFIQFVNSFRRTEK